MIILQEGKNLTIRVNKISYPIIKSICLNQFSEKEEARAKGQVTSGEKSDQTFPSVPKPSAETNNNWITKLVPSSTNSFFNSISSRLLNSIDSANNRTTSSQFFK